MKNVKVIELCLPLLAMHEALTDIIDAGVNSADIDIDSRPLGNASKDWHFSVCSNLNQSTRTVGALINSGFYKKYEKYMQN